MGPEQTKTEYIDIQREGVQLMTDFSDYNGKYIDLHTHSTTSDGSMTPAELVRHAYERGLSAVALTDHDTVAGVEDALEAGIKTGIEVIAGVEISVSLSGWGILACEGGSKWKGDSPVRPDSGGTTPHIRAAGELVMNGTDMTYEPEMHLLGYFFNGDYESILMTLEELRRKREQRNPRIVAKLNEMGFDITMDEVRAKAHGGIVGRPHIARVLMEKGYTASVEEGFDKYLAAGRPAYVKKDKLTPEQGIAAILQSGGVPVLAHPIHLGLPAEQLADVLERLKAAGLKGIEALYSENTPEQTRELLELAEKKGLKVTGGSDFHGSFKPDIEIGVGRGDLRVPGSLLNDLKDAGRRLI